MTREGERRRFARAVLVLREQFDRATGITRFVYWLNGLLGGTSTVPYRRPRKR